LFIGYITCWEELALVYILNFKSTLNHLQIYEIQVNFAEIQRFQ